MKIASKKSVAPVVKPVVKAAPTKKAEPEKKVVAPTKKAVTPVVKPVNAPVPKEAPKTPLKAVETQAAPEPIKSKKAVPVAPAKVVAAPVVEKALPKPVVKKVEAPVKKAEPEKKAVTKAPVKKVEKKVAPVVEVEPEDIDNVEEDEGFIFEQEVETPKGVYTMISDFTNFQKVFVKELTGRYPFRVLAFEGVEGKMTELLVTFVSKEFIHTVDVSSTDGNAESEAILSLADVKNQIVPGTNTPVCLYRFTPASK